MFLFRSISILSILLFLTIALPSAGQKKSPSSNIKEKIKNGKEDPWADYEEEKDSVARWELGIGFGGYFPSKYSANYYNGSPKNINTVEYVMSITQWYRDIMQALGNPDTLLLDKVGS